MFWFLSSYSSKQINIFPLVSITTSWQLQKNPFSFDFLSALLRNDHRAQYFLAVFFIDFMP